MTESVREMFVMIAKPKGEETSAINLSQNIWKVEEELDLLFSSVKNAYESYIDPGESGILLKNDGTLVLSYPSKEKCIEKFAEMKKRLAETRVVPQIAYSEPELDRYEISKKMQGKLEDVAPQDLINFLRGEKQEILYDPKKITYEFIDPKNQKNFIKIMFVKEVEKKLLLDVTVESNKVEYAKETIKQIESLFEK